jgi:thiamine biosynthesis protein ThiS
MRLTINGKDREVPQLATLEDLIEHLGIHRMIAVARNGEILRKQDFGVTMLSDGDELEIVHMVGGG